MIKLARKYSLDRPGPGLHPTLQSDGLALVTSTTVSATRIVGETDKSNMSSQWGGQFTLTVDINFELLGVIRRDSIESLADVGPHVGSVDVCDVQDGRRYVASWVMTCYLIR